MILSPLAICLGCLSDLVWLGDLLQLDDLRILYFALHILRLYLLAAEQHHRAILLIFLPNNFTHKLREDFILLNV
uniref:Uncharacterized protein n=1 Tax=Glossina palpalis gambiensis TaxID=67801 RepID=A0A1B0BHZ6_9MUSC